MSSSLDVLREVYGEEWVERYQRHIQNNRTWRPLELKIRERGSQDRPCKRQPLGVEQWQKDAIEGLYRDMDKERNPVTIMCTAAEYGFELEYTGILEDMDKIGEFRKQFKTFYKSYSPGYVDTDRLGSRIDGLDIEIEKVSDTPFTDSGLPNLKMDTRYHGIVERQADDAGLTKPDVIRVLLARGLKEADSIHEDDREKAHLLVKNTRDTLEDARCELEGIIASFTGKSLAYLSENMDDEGIDQLRDIQENMVTEFKDSVRIHLEVIQEEQDNGLF